ncbi:hypothetical protein GCM10009836_45730 [Pseudonocardia ailaonensis]|uniref:HTH gntR-type domain-containing protein n=1 Tax=Pseudonocardia ailaonensis TaxID=367279 RepID=A0ABN2NEG0_9PSEU
MTAPTGRPRYLEVADDLRSAIAGGTYPVGSELPSTSQLTTRYGASTTVVRAAVKELRNEGLVKGQPGKAVYVTATPDTPPAASTGDLESRLQELSDFVRGALSDLDVRLQALESQDAHQRPS